MKQVCLFVLTIVVASTAYAQSLFNKSKPIAYTKTTITTIKDTSVKLKVIKIDLKAQKGFNIDSVVVVEQKARLEESVMHFYKDSKLVQKVLVPYWIKHIIPIAEFADFNKDGIPDIKFRIRTLEKGTTALLNYKVFLMSQQSKYKVMSFVDFSSEKEYDLNGDGIAEIIGCSTTNFNGKNYWVYNIYNWVNGSLKSVSKDYDYPIWTLVDNKTNKVIAKDIPADARLSTLRAFPNEYYAK